MSKLIFNTGNTRVGTIAERDAIVKRFDGMQVSVTDATGDSLLGGGMARYEWIALESRWALVWSDIKKTVAFISEQLTIENGAVTASHYPINATVWGALVFDADGVIIADVKPIVVGNVINIGSNDFDGEKLYCSYAYSEMLDVSMETLSVDALNTLNSALQAEVTRATQAESALSEQIAGLQTQVQGLNDLIYAGL